MNRIEIINLLIKKNNYKSYLEIGCQSDVCFSSIKCENKVGVDPQSGGTFRGTSDDFFKQNTGKFDVIFIDGLHYAHQVLSDIKNSLLVLNEGGIIVCHDMLPTSEESQRVPRETKVWYGNCWKAFFHLRSNKDLAMFTIDTDCGCGIIKKGKQAPLPKVELATLTYTDFEMYKHTYMSIVSVDQFKQMCL